MIIKQKRLLSIIGYILYITVGYCLTSLLGYLKIVFRFNIELGLPRSNLVFKDCLKSLTKSIERFLAASTGSV